jgi:pimeloyl-ACP methyl ester carboxylesterase
MVDAMAPGLATLHTIPRAGHVSKLEAPDAFREAIATFVSSLA